VSLRVRTEAKARADQGDLRGALEHLRPLEDDADALALKAVIFEELGEDAAAELAWRQVLLHNPAHVEAHLRLVLAASRVHDQKELLRWGSELAQLLRGRDDTEPLGSGGIRVGYARSVLESLLPQRSP
jgi:hypothetical protein